MLTDEQAEQYARKAKALADSLGLKCMDRLVDHYMRTEGLSFLAAMRRIAEECGVAQTVS